MKKLKLPVLCMILYGLAGLLAVYTIWVFIHCIGYISGPISSGQLTFGGNEFDIVSFYMSSCTQYLLFAVILLFLKNWTYYDLQQKIKYKAEEYGIKVEFVKPQYTSQR